MEWINALMLIALLVMTAQQKRKADLPEPEAPVRAGAVQPASEMESLPLHPDWAAAAENLTASQAELSGLQEKILKSQEELLAAVKACLDRPVPETIRAGGDSTGEFADESRRQVMAAEKMKFEKEVREEERTLDWYEKEFSIGLDALLELFLHVPLPTQKSILAQMPNSVMKKGFMRLSDKIIL
jgi:hypothetical protein